MIFYMYDLKTYQHQTREFYLDIEKTLPGKIITENDLLVQEIRNAKTHDNIDNFIKQFASLEDGKATKRVVEKLFV